MGDRSEGPFLRLYERLPEAGLYRSDAYPVYLGWLPPGRHVVGKGSAVNWNEGLHEGLHLVWRGKLNRLARRTKGVHQERGDAGVFHSPSVLASVAEIQYPCILRTPNNKMIVVGSR